MPFNGSGTFQRVYNWTADANAGINILSAEMDTEDDGFAGGLSTCITKNGQTTITANLPMAGYRHTGVGNSTAADQYAVVGQLQNTGYTWGGTAGGTANAITISVNPAITSYVSGQFFEFIASASNTSAATLAIGGLAAKNITKKGAISLVAGDIPSGAVVTLVYDGTQFQLLGCDNFSQGSDIASASTVNLDSGTWNVVDVTGTTTITAITLAAGKEVTARFTGILTLTNGASLVLPNGQDIITAAGDYAVFRGYTSSVVRCVLYTKANGAVLGSSRVMGQNSTNNSGTPNSLFDLNCDQVTLKDSKGFTITRYLPGVITNNITSAGPVANGRDQAGAFSNGTWLHFYWIWNGTTLATLSSTSATAPTLPFGYTFSAYAGAVYFSGGGALTKTRIKGAWAFYETSVNVLAIGNAVTETAISLTTAIPSNALEFQTTASIGTTGNTTSAQNTTTFRVVSGSDFQQITDRATNFFAGTMVYQLRFPNISQNLYYLNTKATDGMQNTGVSIQGYKLNNGGE